MNAKYLSINKVVKVIQILTILVIFFLLASFLPSHTAHAAEQTLRVSPVIINITLSPDKTSTHTVSIENVTRQPIPLRATLNNFETSGEEGGYTFENALPNPLLSWIKMSDNEFILGPLEKKEITLTFKTPKSIPVGGYYGMLFFEPVLQNSSNNSTQVNSKIGVLLLANIGVPNPNAKQADIVTFSPSWISQDGMLPYLLRVQNVSLNFFTAKPSITLKPLLPFISDVKEVLPEEKIVFPGKIRRWEETDKIRDLSPNVYEVQLQVSTGNGNVIETTRYVVIIPYIKVLLFGVTIIVILFLLIKRKKVRKAMGELFHS